MGEVVILKPVSAVEFDGPALALITHLSDAVLKIRSLTIEVQEVAGDGDERLSSILGAAQGTLDKLISIMMPIEAAICAIESNADGIIASSADNQRLRFSVNSGYDVVVSGFARVLCSTIRVQKIFPDRINNNNDLLLCAPGSLRLARISYRR